MRSRADVRRALEHLLRVALAVALLVALARSLAPAAAFTTERRVATRDLGAALLEATGSPHLVALAVDIDSMPSRTERAWLAALRGAGVGVTWTGRPAPLAIEVDRAREPAGPALVAMVADSGAALALADSAGPIDSVGGSPRGATIAAGAVVGEVRSTRGRFVARAAVPPASTPRAVLLLGRAAWEGKFVGAALQEAGWTVRARQPVAPGVSVADAGLLPLDTSRYAAVVALDSTAADLAPQVARFVAQGGGLVLAGTTATLPAFAPLAPAQPSARQPGRLALDADSVTLASLPVRPLSALRGDAVRLDGTPASPMVAVRRAGLGRVLAIGYDETWRWRMMGGTGGEAAHRAWWSRMVGMAAPAASGAPAGADAAPVAALVDRLGPPSALAQRPAAARPAGLAWYLLVIIVVALLAETASRRFRGAS